MVFFPQSNCSNFWIIRFYCRVKVFSHTVKLSHLIVEAPMLIPVKNAGRVISFKGIFVLFLSKKGIFRNINSYFVWENSFNFIL